MLFHFLIKTVRGMSEGDSGAVMPDNRDGWFSVPGNVILNRLKNEG